MSEAKAIARVVRSVVDTFKRREWQVSTSRSNKSLSRYVHARKGTRRVTIRVSDHRPTSKTKCDISYTPKHYQQRRLAQWLDGKRKYHGRRFYRKRAER